MGRPAGPAGSAAPDATAHEACRRRKYPADPIDMEARRSEDLRQLDDARDRFEPGGSGLRLAGRPQGRRPVRCA